MRDFYDDHSGDDEEVPPAYPESPLRDDPVYHSPTQPVEPVYPVPDDVEDVDSDDDDDESLLDKVKRWFTGSDDPDVGGF